MMVEMFIIKITSYFSLLEQRVAKDLSCYEVWGSNMYDCNSLKTGISRTNRINLKFVLKQSQLQVSFKLSYMGERDKIFLQWCLFHSASSRSYDPIDPISMVFKQQLLSSTSNYSCAIDLFEDN